MGIVMVIKSGSNKNKLKSSGVGETTTQGRPGLCRGVLRSTMAPSDKRKNLSPTSHRPKKRKTAHVYLDGLSWRPVVRTHVAGLDFDEGLLELEEVDGVQVVYEQTANGRVAKFLVRIFPCV
jgi:hypothetical protein